MLTRKQMIEFIVAWDEKPVSHVELLFIDMPKEKILPVFKQMKKSRDEMLEERIAVAV